MFVKKDKRFYKRLKIFGFLCVFDYLMVNFVLVGSDIALWKVLLMICVNIYALLGILFSFISSYFAWMANIKQENMKNAMKDAINESNAKNDFYREKNFDNEQKNDANTVGEEELKSLYRELLKKYHPDFAQGEDDKKFRSDITAKINKAYKEKDINTLKLFV